MLAKLAITSVTLASLVLIGCDDDDDLDIDDDVDEAIDEADGGDDDDDDDDIPATPTARCFTLTNLVGSTDYPAERTDPNLINAWGLAPVFGAFGVVSEGAGTLAMYTARGASAVTAVPDGLPLGEGYTGIAVNDQIAAMVSEQGLVSKFSLTSDRTHDV